MNRQISLLLVDNYDSFTYNLYQAFALLGIEITVLRNDSTHLEMTDIGSYDAIVISPGPGTPATAGRSKEIIASTKKDRPILGVCLGMQCINEVSGGDTVHAPVPVHGKTSFITHNGAELFRSVPSPFKAARYHSLIISTSANIETIAVTDNGIPMAVHIPGSRIWGVQFHPESFLTPYGPQILENFLELATL